MQGCCSDACMEIINLPIEKQRVIRKGRPKEDSLSVYKSRLRPNLSEQLNNGITMHMNQKNMNLK
jgi:hypothetical protein